MAFAHAIHLVASDLLHRDNHPNVTYAARVPNGSAEKAPNVGSRSPVSRAAWARKAS